MAVEAEDDFAIGTVLGDETVIVSKLHAPTPTYNETVAKELYGATGLSEVIATGVQHVATSCDFARIGIDLKAQHACALRIVTVTIVEKGDRIVIMERGVMLAVKALIGWQGIAVDAPENVARLILAVDLYERVEHTERTEPVAIGQYLYGVEVYIVVARIEDRTAPGGHVGMIGAPPVEHHRAVFYFLQIAHSQRLTIHLTLDVRGRGDVMGWREEIEVMAVERIAITYESVATGLGVDGVNGLVMLVEQNAHAWVVTREGTVGKSRVG